MVAAAQAATVTLSPTSVYESTSSWLSLDVNNLNGSSIVTQVIANSSLSLLSAATYSGWTTSTTAQSATWSGGSVETNVRSALFEFQVRAPLVLSDVQVIVEARMNGAPLFLNLNVLNDVSPPNVTVVSPNGFVAPAAQNVSLLVVDSETGVQNASYQWSDCSGSPVSVSLTRSGSLFTGLANFAGFAEGSTVCYTVTATNNAGETANFSGQLRVDATPPSVTAFGPTGFVNESVDFRFQAADNLASSLSCALSVNGSVLQTLSAANNTNVVASSNLSNFSEGSLVWSVSCVDGVGLSGSSQQGIVLDKQPPVITVNTPATILRGVSTSFSSLITDTIGVASVNASFDGSAVGLAQNGSVYQGVMNSAVLGAKQLVVQARDNAGRTTASNVSVQVVPNHRVTLSLSPNPANPTSTITASGSVVGDGAFAASSVLVRTPSGNFTTPLSNGSYSVNFGAPAAGSYLIYVEFVENGVTYVNQSTLTVASTVNADPSFNGGSGIARGGGRRSSSGGSSGGRSSDSSSDSTVSSAEESAPKNVSRSRSAVYQPLDPEVPRQALTPKATGAFTLPGPVKWLALFIGLLVLAGVGSYAYQRRAKGEPKDGQVNWDNYFEK